ncbi:MAG TPA: hypothetical protein VNA89_10055 [Gemmatimonadaceae bacterium]|nr:hypothetical protein [Gemmatimonadaceae bacterium]
MGDVRSSGRPRGEAAESAPPDWLEGLATWASALLLAALLAFLAWDAMGEHRAPEFRTEVERPRTVGGRHHIPVVVHNLGDLAAKAVQVSVTPAGDSAATASFTIDWLPGHSRHRGVAIFAKPPAGPLRAEVTGYSEP